jgi:DNA-binding transcriptional ArsR family regulator
MSLPNVSKHLKVLRDAGLVTQGRDAQWRPCHLETTRLRDANAWIEQYKRFWEERFERLDAYLRELQQEGQDRPDDDATNR